MSVKKIKDNVFYVGTKDPTRKLFDQLVPLPDGTSYNAYLIKGSEKTALIDTSYPPKCNEFIANLNEMQLEKLDYIIANHAEQDHSGCIPAVLELFPEAKVITNAKCKDLIISLLQVSPDKITEIKDGETLSLGDKTLEFIIAPWVHWPDTMFTYLKEEKIIFTCDFLGAHLAVDDLYVTDEAAVYKSAKRYYAEIMMPFRVQIKKYLQKLDNMDIELIAPSHGPIYQNPQFILNAYKDWAGDKVKNEVIIPYITMYESTRMMVDYLADALKKKGITVKPFDVISDDIGELAMELVDAATVVIASPFVLAGPHPNMIYAAALVNALRPKLKFAAIIGSYGWGGNMVDQIKCLLGNLKAEMFEPIIIKGQPKESDYQNLENLADEIYKKHSELLK